jgi:hypothetical protein
VRLRQEEATCWRIADPDWEDPFDGSYFMPIGQRAWDDELDGVACRSAALLTPEGEELAWFDRPRKRLSASGPPVRHEP